MKQLIAISIGPVQEFIQAGRRTRDLWFGSRLLSELSWSVAQAVQQQGGALIFPVISENVENVANVIVAELPAESDPSQIAHQAQMAAQECWLRHVDTAFQIAREVIRQDIWNDQKDDVIEFYAVWVRCSGNYVRDRARLMRLLAGRKNCRDFRPAKGRAGVPKSSLDGLRESVLHDPEREPWPRGIHARLRIRPGEQLDVVGVVKRLAGGRRPYPSISRIAADPWIRGQRQNLGPLLEACRGLPENAVHRLETTYFPQYSVFPYEGTLVYQHRYHEFLQEVRGELTEDDLQPLRQALSGLPEPQPYLAVLVADGDQMGKLISQLNSPEQHRQFSQTLSKFAQSVQEIVEQHYGVLVYSGGDDVLAFVPIDMCLKCARQLHDEFGARLQPYGPASLSVGIAIGHFLEDLEDLLTAAREAERDAKNPDRDGLAIHLHKRSGAPITFRARWQTQPDQTLQQLAELFLEGAISHRLPYDLSPLVDLYASWPDNTNLTAALRQDVLRIIRAKQPRAGQANQMQLLALVQTLQTAEDLRRLTTQLLISRQLAIGLKQASGATSPAKTAVV